MTDFWTWATEHWWLAFWLIFWAMVLGENVLTTIVFKLPNSLIRAGNIRRQGWPPAHLDADGDFKPDPEPAEPTP